MGCFFRCFGVGFWFWVFWFGGLGWFGFWVFCFWVWGMVLVYLIIFLYIVYFLEYYYGLVWVVFCLFWFVLLFGGFGLVVFWLGVFGGFYILIFLDGRVYIGVIIYSVMYNYNFYDYIVMFNLWCLRIMAMDFYGLIVMILRCWLTFCWFGFDILDIILICLGCFLGILVRITGVGCAVGFCCGLICGF